MNAEYTHLLNVAFTWGIIITIISFMVMIGKNEDESPLELGWWSFVCGLACFAMIATLGLIILVPIVLFIVFSIIYKVISFFRGLLTND